MRLLRFEPAPATNELIITLEEFPANVPPYAVLSHQWGRTEDEVSFQDFVSRQATARQKKGWQKIDGCCRQALKHGFQYCWIDTCCIDKSSSAELSEAINSMYTWYEQAQVCYAYLMDVPSNGNGANIDASFRSSRWFTRGWTLQELIAPRNLIFLTGDWNEMGNKIQLANVIQDVTRVPTHLIASDSSALSRASVAQKMSWATRRQTTRIEDRAYSLMGIFGVSIPIIYGEGLAAFRRLQEEIIRNSADHSIFAWESRKDFSGLLAESPDDFEFSSEFYPMDYKEYVDLFGIQVSKPDYTITNFGLQIQLPQARLNEPRESYVAFLACTRGNDRELTWIYLAPHPGRPAGHYIRAKRGTVSIGTGLDLKASMGGHNYPRKCSDKIWISAPDSSVSGLAPLPVSQWRVVPGGPIYRILLRKSTEIFKFECYPPSGCRRSGGHEFLMECWNGSFVVIHSSGLKPSTKRWVLVIGVEQGKPWVDLIKTDKTCKAVFDSCIPKYGQFDVSAPHENYHRVYLYLDEESWSRSKAEDFLDFSFSYSYIKTPMTGFILR